MLVQCAKKGKKSRAMHHVPTPWRTRRKTTQAQGNVLLDRRKKLTIIHHDLNIYSPCLPFLLSPLPCLLPLALVYTKSNTLALRSTLFTLGLKGPRPSTHYGSCHSSTAHPGYTDCRCQHSPSSRTRSSPCMILPAIQNHKTAGQQLKLMIGGGKSWHARCAREHPRSGD